ncbi:hypothetical protein J7J26_00835 [Candidatus Micrarchaeota archaeon]|nr:hypothetical protein [Candidatus Micrarchaeota archaeon]
MTNKDNGSHKKFPYAKKPLTDTLTDEMISDEEKYKRCYDKINELINRFNESIKKYNVGNKKIDDIFLNSVKFYVKEIENITKRYNETNELNKINPKDYLDRIFMILLINSDDIPTGGFRNIMKSAIYSNDTRIVKEAISFVSQSETGIGVLNEMRKRFEILKEFNDFINESISEGRKIREQRRKEESEIRRRVIGTIPIFEVQDRRRQSNDTQREAVVRKELQTIENGHRLDDPNNREKVIMTVYNAHIKKKEIDAAYRHLKKFKGKQKAMDEILKNLFNFQYRMVPILFREFNNSIPDVVRAISKIHGFRAAIDYMKKNKGYIENKTGIKIDMDDVIKNAIEYDISSNGMLHTSNEIGNIKSAINIFYKLGYRKEIFGLLTYIHSQNNHNQNEDKTDNDKDEMYKEVYKEINSILGSDALFEIIEDDEQDKMNEEDKYGIILSRLSCAIPLNKAYAILYSRKGLDLSLDVAMKRNETKLLLEALEMLNAPEQHIEKVKPYTEELTNDTIKRYVDKYGFEGTFMLIFDRETKTNQNKKNILENVIKTFYSFGYKKELWDVLTETSVGELILSDESALDILSKSIGKENALDVLFTRFNINDALDKIKTYSGNNTDKHQSDVHKTIHKPDQQDAYLFLTKKMKIDELLSIADKRKEQEILFNALKKTGIDDAALNAIRISMKKVNDKDIPVLIKQNGFDQTFEQLVLSRRGIKPAIMTMYNLNYKKELFAYFKNKYKNNALNIIRSALAGGEPIGSSTTDNHETENEQIERIITDIIYSAIGDKTKAMETLIEFTKSSGKAYEITFDVLGKDETLSIANMRGEYTQAIKELILRNKINKQYVKTETLLTTKNKEILKYTILERSREVIDILDYEKTVKLAEKLGILDDLVDKEIGRGDMRIINHTRNYLPDEASAIILIKHDHVRRGVERLKEMGKSDYMIAFTLANLKSPEYAFERLSWLWIPERVTTAMYNWPNTVLTGLRKLGVTDNDIIDVIKGSWNLEHNMRYLKPDVQEELLKIMYNGMNINDYIKMCITAGIEVTINGYRTIMEHGTDKDKNRMISYLIENTMFDDHGNLVINKAKVKQKGDTKRKAFQKETTITKRTKITKRTRRTKTRKETIIHKKRISELIFKAGDIKGMYSWLVEHDGVNNTVDIMSKLLAPIDLIMTAAETGKGMREVISTISEDIGYEKTVDYLIDYLGDKGIDIMFNPNNNIGNYISLSAYQRLCERKDIGVKKAFELVSERIGRKRTLKLAKYSDMEISTIQHLWNDNKVSTLKLMLDVFGVKETVRIGLKAVQADEFIDGALRLNGQSEAIFRELSYKKYHDIIGGPAGLMKKIVRMIGIANIRNHEGLKNFYQKLVKEYANNKPDKLHEIMLPILSYDKTIAWILKIKKMKPNSITSAAKVLAKRIREGKEYLEGLKLLENKCTKKEILAAMSTLPETELSSDDFDRFMLVFNASYESNVFYLGHEDTVHQNTQSTPIRATV